MPIVGPALGALIQTKIDSRMSAVAGVSPLAQKNPAFFIALCMAIGNGIATGGPTVMFTTSDTGSAGAPPVPGVGAGVGIIPDPEWFVQDCYTRIRGYILSDLGKTSHDPFPPSSGNSGEYLMALCQGINDAIQELYPTSWILTSTHPTIYTGSGTINEGNFSGLSDSAIKGAIVAAAPTLQGSFWPKLAQAIAESYVSLIHEHSTGQVTISGVCSPSSSQVCGIGSSGSGSGVAE